MDGINNTDNTNSLKRVENNKTKKDEAVNESQSEQKTGDLSEQMAYLGAINRVNIKKYVSSNMQENISFKGSVDSDKEFKDQSNEKYKLPNYKEFLKLKKKIKNIFKQNPDIKEYFKDVKLERNNIPIVFKIVTNECFYNNPDFMQKAQDIVRYTKTTEAAQAKCDLLDKILSDEKLFNNPHFMKESKYIVRYTETTEAAQAKCDLLDKILFDERLFNNPDFMESLGYIVSDSNTTEKARAKCDMIDKILSDKRLFNNPDFMKYTGFIVSSAYTSEEAQVTCDFLDKILSDTRLYNNPDFMKNLGYIVSDFNTPEKARAKCDVIDKILSDERLFNNPDFMKKAGAIVGYTNTTEKAQIKCDLIDKILSDKRLFNNSDFMKAAGDIVFVTDTPEEAQAKCDLIDKILSDKNMLNNPNFMKNEGSIIYGTHTPEQAQVKYNLIDKILSNEKLFNNIAFMKKAGHIIYNTNTLEHAQAKCDLIDKFLSDKRLFNNPDFMKKAGDIICITNTPEQAQAKCDLIDKILSDERLFNNPDFMKYTGFIVSSSYTSEEAQVTCDFLDKILSDEKLSDNHNFMKIVARMVSNADTPEEAQVTCNFLDKILSDEKLSDNHNFMKEAVRVVYYADTRKQAQIADKILSNERLFNNPDFMKYAGNIVSSANTPERALITDKIISDISLFNNPDFMKYAGSIVSSANTPENAQAKCNLLDKILSDERLFNNPDFMKYAGNIVSSANTHEKAQARCDLLDKILSDERLFDNPDFMKSAGYIIGSTETAEQAQNKISVIDKYLNDKECTLTPNQLVMLLQQEEDEISYKDLSRLNKTIGKEKTASLSKEDTVIAVKFLPFYNRENINEIPLVEKRNLLRNLVASNSDLFNTSENLHELFPMLPKNQEEYCALLPSIVRSIGIETNTLSLEEVENFNVSLSFLGDTLKNISDDEFNNLDIKQEYSKDNFILDTLEKVKELTPKERQKVYDYFGFELHHNKKSKIGFSITGYPVNLNNGKKLAQITDPKTKAVVEDLRENVIHFSEDNHITCNNENVETLLNEIAASLPELRPMIGKMQHGTHDFDIMQHSLKVMKKIVENPEYEKLNDSDKKIMLLASLLHDITKKEGTADKTHENEGSFDSFFIAKKFNLSREEEIKLHTLIKNHEWLGRVNRSKSEEKLTKNIQSTAYDLRHDNLFDMSLIFTHADLKAVRKDDSFHDTKEGDERIDFRGNVRSYGESADYYAGMIKECINELQKSQPILPTTKLPSSDEIKSKIKTVNQDGSTNIKGVYEDKNGLVIIKYNEVEDWQAIGLPKGSISRGITAKTDRSDTVNTGNIKFIAHGLDYPNQLAKFDAFSLIDSDALLSVSYMERPESKYRLFRPQGVLLDVDTKYIHGGGETDAGSGCGKNIQNFKDNYIFGAYREKDRLFISNLIKEAADMNDEEYVEFVKENSDKSFNETEPVELREKLIKAFASINSHKRRGEREYNEMYISNPKPMGVFAYNTDTNGTIGNPVEFLNSDKVSKRTDFLKQYALENNIPFVVFGD